MLSAIRPAIQTAPASAPAVASPHAPASEAPLVASDGVTLSPPPALEPTAAATAPDGEGAGRRAAIVAAGLTAAVLAGVLGPVVGGALNTVGPDVASQSVTLAIPGGVNDPTLVLPGAAKAPAPTGEAAAAAVETQQGDSTSQQQSVTELVGQMGGLAEASSKLLPQANGAHAEWAKDLTAMQATAKSLVGHVDALIRDGKTYNAAHHLAIDAGLTRYAQQAAELQDRIAREQPVVDQFLGQNRDNLNQIGTISYNLEANINKAASQEGYFTPQRQELRQLGKEVHKATLDVAISTEKATAARALDKALAENLKVVTQLIEQTQKANDAAKTKGANLDQLDAGVRVLENAAKVLGNIVDQSTKSVTESATRAAAGADDLAVVYGHLGGGAPPTVAPQVK